MNHNTCESFNPKRYEAFVALLRGLGADIVGVSVATIGFGIAAFALTLACLPSRAGRLAAAILFCATPAIVANASAMMETNLALATVALFLCLHLRLCALPGPPGPSLAIAVVFAGWAVVLSRLDAAIVVTASLLGFFVVRRRPVYLVILASTGVAAFLSYWLLRGNFGFLGLFLISDDPVGRSLLKAAAGATALMWTAGGVAAAMLLVNRRDMAPESSMLLLLATGLYAIRFVILPLEIEYLLPLYLLVITMAARTADWRQLKWVVPCAAAGMLAQPQLLSKSSAVSDAYHLSPRLGAPGLVTDLQDRLEIGIAARDDYWQWLEHQVETPLRHNWMNGFIESPDRRTLVIFRDAAHQFVSARWERRQPPLSRYERVVLCPDARSQGMGWRQLRHRYPATTAGAFAEARPLRCLSLIGPVDRSRYIEAAHAVWPET